MRYVVSVKDPITGKVTVGDVPTTKSHARRWANQYIKDGFEADIVEVNSDSITPGEEIKCAFAAEKDHRWEWVKVRLSWINMEEEVASLYLSMCDLYEDWMGECMLCPPNDAEIFDVQIGSTTISNEALGEFRFEELMGFVEQTWPKKKRGRSCNPDKATSVKEPVPGRKRGRPSRAERERMLLGFGR